MDYTKRAIFVYLACQFPLHKLLYLSLIFIDMLVVLNARSNLFLALAEGNKFCLNVFCLDAYTLGISITDPNLTASAHVNQVRSLASHV